jgi:hypothetical protein
MAMQRFLAALLAVACVTGLSCSAFARDGGHHGSGRGVARDSTIVVAPAPERPILNPIPTPLPPPAQAPVVNGPVSQPSFRGLGGIGQ